VLSRRTGINLSNQDIITNVIGGLHIGEPAADLGLALAVASSYRDAPVAPGLVALGEVGLSGELRPVPQMERRLAEAARLGFKRCLIPDSMPKNSYQAKGVELLKASTLAQALRLGLVRSTRKTGKSDEEA